jgi:hypothetical protein
MACFRKWLSFILCVSICIHASTQDLTGDWNGYLTQNDKSWAFTLNMKIIQSGNQLQGYARATEPGGAFVRHEFTGQIVGDQITIQETRVVEDGGRGLWSWCIKILSGRITQSGGLYVIEGGWRNDGGKFYQNGPQNSGSYNCPPGRFKISRPYTCAEQNSSRVLDAVESWRKRGQYETSTQWQQRTSNINTDRHFKEVLADMSAELLKKAELVVDYNRESELATIRSNCFGEFQLRVPAAEANCFTRNFRKEDIQQLVFAYNADTRTISVDSVLLSNPCRETAYTYPLPLPTDIASSKVKPVDSSFSQRSLAISREMLVSRSSVELRIYDNGNIDGDIISIYFNGQQIRSRQTLTSSPIRIILQLDPTRENIIAMFAENLGNIPPNTALMVVDDGQQTQEVQLASTLQTTGAIRLRVKK